MTFARCAFVAAVGFTAGDATGMMMKRANPIRKVVTMIQNIQKKVEDEGKLAEELYEKFLCECNQQSAELTKAIEGAESKGSDVGSALEAGKSQAKQLGQDITQAKKDRAAAKEAIASATGIREKELAAFKDMAGEASANIDAMGKAITAIEQGGAAFIQTAAAQKLKDLVNNNQDISGEDHDDIMSFLQGEEGSQGTGEIVGMLKQMKEEMAGNLATDTASEADSVATYHALVKAKLKEFESLQAAIEEKMARLGELGVANAESANDGGDTADALVKDKKMLADLKTACAARTAAWEAEKKTRGEELLALSDTIKMLNSDDALELFKKALPSASSFMQIQVSEKQVRDEALKALKVARKKHKSTKLDFVALALRGKKVGLQVVVDMIDKMVGALSTEQKEDDDKKAYCLAEFDKADDEKKALERKVSDAETAIKDAEGSVATLTDEIKSVKAGIISLDGEVAIATAQRMKENSAFKELTAQNGAAGQLIGMAKERMNKFYNPSFAQVSEEDSEDGQVKTKGSGGVIQMMAAIENDLEKETAVATTEEKNAQADYEAAMVDAKEKRTADSKLLEDKESAKAQADEAVQTSVDAKKAAGKELQGVTDYIMTLRADCDWLIKYYDTRKQARADEIDALGKAKDVLNGADFSFLQMSHTHRRLRGAHH